MLKQKSLVAKQQRRKLSTEFKAKVALASFCEDKTLAQLCTEFQVHCTQITEWKRLLVERVAGVLPVALGLIGSPPLTWYRGMQRLAN